MIFCTRQGKCMPNSNMLYSHEF